MWHQRIPPRLIPPPRVPYVKEHFQQIRALVDKQNIPSFDAVLMGGDFNE